MYRNKVAPSRLWNNWHEFALFEWRYVRNGILCSVSTLLLYDYTKTTGPMALPNVEFDIAPSRLQRGDIHRDRRCLDVHRDVNILLQEICVGVCHSLYPFGGHGGDLRPIARRQLLLHSRCLFVCVAKLRRAPRLIDIECTIITLFVLLQELLGRGILDYLGNVVEIAFLRNIQRCFSYVS